MDQWEIIQWCINKNFNNPNKLGALLSTFTPDLEELNSWDIIENYETFSGCEEKFYTINSIKYEILSEDEVMKEIEEFKKIVEEDYTQEVPAHLREYINWDRYWKDYPITPESYLSKYSIIIFRGIKYFYNEYEIQSDNNNIYYS